MQEGREHGRVGSGVQVERSETRNHQADILQGRSKFDLRSRIWARRRESPSPSLL